MNPWQNKNPSSDARSAARAEGRTTYFGKPCQHGHNGERFTANASCCGCQDAKNRKVQESAIRARNALAMDRTKPPASPWAIPKAFQA